MNFMDFPGILFKNQGTQYFQKFFLLQVELATALLSCDNLNYWNLVFVIQNSTII